MRLHARSLRATRRRLVADVREERFDGIAELGGYDNIVDDLLSQLLAKKNGGA